MVVGPVRDALDRNHHESLHARGGRGVRCRGGLAAVQLLHLGVIQVEPAHAGDDSVRGREEVAPGAELGGGALAPLDGLGPAVRARGAAPGRDRCGRIESYRTSRVNSTGVAKVAE